jgi:uncharacterized protein (TIGR02594 family)
MPYLLIVTLLTLVMINPFVKQEKVTDMEELLDFSEFGEYVVETPKVTADSKNPEAFGGLPKQGDTGEEVRLVQQALADRNISSVGEVDGAFGNKTSLAIQEFQEKAGLPRTGVVDQTTYTQLVDTAPSFDETGKTKPALLFSLEEVEAATTSEAVTEVVAKTTPAVAADNPLEYIFNKGFIGLDEKNPEHQGTIAGFINNAVPNFVTKDSQVTQSSKAWCGAFVDHVLENLGVARLDTGDKYDKLRAAKYLGYGEDTGGIDNAQAGDLVVIQNSDGWHVSFYVGKNEKGEVLALGGNQANRVKVTNYSATKVRGVRRITDVGSMDVGMLKAISSDIVENSGEEGSR